MIVDCMTCPVRGQGCHDCAVTVLLGLPGFAGPAGSTGLAEPPSGAGLGPLADLPLDPAESRVVSMFVGAGLVGAGAASQLRAQRESVQSWGPERNVG
jgi:hypothetical protein